MSIFKNTGMKRALTLLLLLLWAAPAFADGLAAMAEARFYGFLFGFLFLFNTVYLLWFMLNRRSIGKSSGFSKYSLINLLLCLVLFIFLIKGGIENGQNRDFSFTDLLFYAYPLVGVVTSIYAISRYSTSDNSENDPSNL